MKAIINQVNCPSCGMILTNRDNYSLVCETTHCSNYKKIFNLPTIEIDEKQTINDVIYSWYPYRKDHSKLVDDFKRWLYGRIKQVENTPVYEDGKRMWSNEKQEGARLCLKMLKHELGLE